MSRPVAINPERLGLPKGYSNGVVAPTGARLLFVAGQIGWDAEHRLVAGGFVEQFERALGNVIAVVREAGGDPDDIVKLTLYVVDKGPYLESLKRVGEAYRRLMGRHYPAMALLVVADLLESGALVEIEAVAALPPDGGAPA